MHDRKMMKWMPFNSVIDSKYIIKSIEKEKSKINKPTLSEEQINNYEKIIIESMNNKICLEFTIYEGGFIKKIKGTIIKITPTNKKIYLNNNKYLYFSSIINVSEIIYN